LACRTKFNSSRRQDVHRRARQSVVAENRRRERASSRRSGTGPGFFGDGGPRRGPASSNHSIAVDGEESADLDIGKPQYPGRWMLRSGMIETMAAPGSRSRRRSARREKCAVDARTIALRPEGNIISRFAKAKAISAWRRPARSSFWLGYRRQGGGFFFLRGGYAGDRDGSFCIGRRSQGARVRYAMQA